MGFFGSLLGKDSAKAATQLGQRNASQINSGYDQANTYAGQGYDAAQNRFSPYANQGAKGFTAYNDAIGINGGDARKAAFGNFQSDPFMQYAQQGSGDAINAIFKRYGARGMANSGASGMAVSRAAGERAQGDVNNWLNRLQGVGQQGVGIAGAQSGLDMQHYGGMADRAVGRSTALADIDARSTIAASNARTAGVNNLLSGLGTIGGSVFSAFAPGAKGVSAMGNISNGLSGKGFV